MWIYSTVLFSHVFGRAFVKLSLRPSFINELCSGLWIRIKIYRIRIRIQKKKTRIRILSVKNSNLIFLSHNLVIEIGYKNKSGSGMADGIMIRSFCKPDADPNLYQNISGSATLVIVYLIARPPHV